MSANCSKGGAIVNFLQLEVRTRGGSLFRWTEVLSHGSFLSALNLPVGEHFLARSEIQAESFWNSPPKEERLNRNFPKLIEKINWIQSLACCDFDKIQPGMDCAGGKNLLLEKAPDSRPIRAFPFAGT